MLISSAAYHSILLILTGEKICLSASRIFVARGDGKIAGRLFAFQDLAGSSGGKKTGGGVANLFDRENNT